MNKNKTFIQRLTFLFSRDFRHFLKLKHYKDYNRYLFLNTLYERFPGCSIADDVLMQYPGQVEMGKNTIISPRCYLNCGSEPDLGRITLGENVILGYHSCLYAGSGRITIGNNVDLGVNTILTTQTRSMTQNPVQEPSHFEHIYEDISIGNGTLIASNVTILPGTRIGDYCHVVAGSVVQGKFGDHTTIAGNPARAMPRMPFK